MKKQLFKNFIASRSDLFYINDKAHGHIGTFPINLIYASGTISFSILTTISTDKQEKKAHKKERKKIAQQIGEGLAKKCKFSANDVGFYGIMNGNKNSLDEIYDYIISSFNSQIRNSNIKPLDLCPICKESNCDSLGLYHENYSNLHRHCLQKVIVQQQEKSENYANKENYLTGILGALLGAIVGALPNLFTVTVMNTYYTLAYALIPLASYYGYTKMNGKRSKSAVGIIMISSLLISFLLVFVITAITIVNEGFPLELFWALMKSPEFFPEIAPDMFTSVGFCALGILTTWNMITKKPSTEDDIVIMRETLVAMDIVRINGAPK